MIELFKLDHTNQFPSLDFALDEPNGLLAFGGDLTISRLIRAYDNGIFPWFSENEPLLWWSPDPRGVIELDSFHISKSLAKLIRKNPYTITLNQAFDDVIYACANIARTRQYTLQENEQTPTWITEEMIQAYIGLHKVERAHSVEVWENDELVGGLYGVNVGNVFCGESMFHKKNNTSKLASFALVNHMKRYGMDFIDCQMLNPHLISLGCKEISRSEFICRLKKSIEQSSSDHHWTPQPLSLN